MNGMKPKFAVVSANALQSIGMKSLLEKLAPKAEVYLYHSAEELSAQVSHRFVHYFVSSEIVRACPARFAPVARQTIVMTHGEEDGCDNALVRPHGFHTVNVNVPANVLLKEILTLMQQGHARMRPSRAAGAVVLKARERAETEKLTRREVEVLKQVAWGRSSKEIAESLGVSPSTIISHRKSIMEKLDAHSATKLVIYAVTHGLVRPEEII